MEQSVKETLFAAVDAHFACRCGNVAPIHDPAHGGKERFDIVNQRVAVDEHKDIAARDAGSGVPPDRYRLFHAALIVNEGIGLRACHGDSLIGASSVADNHFKTVGTPEIFRELIQRLRDELAFVQRGDDDAYAWVLQCPSLRLSLTVRAGHRAPTDELPFTFHSRPG